MKTSFPGLAVTISALLIPAVGVQRLSAQVSEQDSETGEPTVTAPATPERATPPPRAADPPPNPRRGHVPRAYQTAPPPPAVERDWGYYDEPPLDWRQRQWRWHTRHVRPQRFARRDLRTKYGFNPPFSPYVYPGFGAGFTYPYGFGGYGLPYGAAGTAYIQGRHDQQRFEEWREHYDKNRAAYIEAMSEGVRLFREAEYPASLLSFVRAAKLNQGDPASRLHATYALVALGNYEDAILMVRRAVQLQSTIPQLPLDIPAEYGPTVEFDAHLRRLVQTAQEAEHDPGLWMLVGFYRYFSGDLPGAHEAFAKAHDLAPRDPIISDFYQSARLLTPSAEK